MDISVIIAVSRPGLAEVAVESLLTQNFSGNYEIILVGEINQKLIELANNISNGEARVRCVLATTVPMRSAAARRNRGATLATGEILAFLDDDAVAEPDWLYKASLQFERDNLLQILGGPNICPGDARKMERLSDVILTTPLLGSGSASYREQKEIQKPRLAEVGEIHLVNCFVRPELFQRMNGFNEGLGYGGEDSEFVYLARRLYGARIVFDPSLTVSHARRPFGTRYLKQRFILRRNTGRLMWRHPHMYIHHPIVILMLLAPFAVVLGFAALPLSIFCVVAAVFVGIYTGLIVWLGFSHAIPMDVNPFLFVPGMILHHAANVAGLFVGLASILWMKGYSDISRATAWSRLGLGGEPLLEPFIEDEFIHKEELSGCEAAV